MFASVSRCAELISQSCRLKVKITGQGHGFEPWISCPLHISYTLAGFSLNFGHMFASVRRCAELISQPCRLKVKVTVKGHEFEPWILCSLHISWTLWKIFIKFGSNVHLSEMMCRTHNNSADLRSRSQFKVTGLSLEFHVHSVSPIPVEGFSLNFGQMFTLVGQCAEPITQPWGLKDKVTV